VSEQRPAYSAPFASGCIQEIQRIEPLETITREWAWEGSFGRGVRIAIIDSGIDASHPAVGGPLAGYAGISEEAGGIVVNTTQHGDLYGHGTACAGIIRSLAPDCELYSVRVLGPSLTAPGDVFAAGLRWAIQNDIQVCNLSLGTTRKEWYAVFHELADQACFRDIMLVCAANNLPAASYPSVYASVISVAAHAGQDPAVFYCNPQPPVEFGARGIDVRVAWTGGGWVTATGNSYAAPHLTGIVARILGKHPNLTVFQMKVILRALSSNVLPDIDGAQAQ
jgi:subtilisin